MSDPKTPEGIVARARRLQEFLNDEIISDAFSRMERRFYEEFKAAKNAEERAKAQGKALVLDELTREFRVITSDGERAMLEIAKREKQEQEAGRTS